MADVELRAQDTIGILAMPGVVSRRSSQGLGWTSMYLAVQAEQPYAAEFAGVGNALLILHLGGPVDVTRGSGAARKRRRIAAGGLFLHPAGRDLAVELGGPLDTLHVYLDGALLQEAAGRDVELAEELGAHDPLLEQLLLALDGTVQRGAAPSRLYADTLGLALAAQLAERHSVGRPRTPARDGGGLGDRELAAVVEVMHDRLAVGVSLAELADTVGRSPSQLARAFKRRTGLPPHRYLMRLRLEQAERLLRASDLPLAQVATESGFAHQEHLTRVMRARLATTPGAMRAAGR